MRRQPHKLTTKLYFQNESVDLLKDYLVIILLIITMKFRNVGISLILCGVDIG